MKTFSTDLLYRGCIIRKSGKQFLKVLTFDGSHWGRYLTIEGAKAAIDANTEKRVMTKEEHASVYAPFHS